MKAAAYKKLAWISLMVFASTVASAAEPAPSEAERLCGYLITKLHAARRAPQPTVEGSFKNQLDVLNELSAHIQGVRPVMEEAIADRLTFAEFQTRAALRGQRVPARYEAEYLETYLRTICADAVTTTTYTPGTNGKFNKPSVRVRLPESFDATEHHYFKEMSKGDSSAAK